MGADKRTKIIETMKKLLLHAESAKAMGSVEEAAAFMLKVGSLQREYRVERHEYEPTIADAADFREYGVTVVGAYTRAAGEQVAWQAILYSIIAEANACQAIISAGSEEGHFFIAGQVVDRAVVVGLSHQLVRSVDYLSGEAWKHAQMYDPTVTYGAAYARRAGIVTEAQFIESYRSGFIQALVERLREDEQKFIEGAPSTALVAISRAVVRTQEYMQKLGGTTGEVTQQVEIRHRGAAERGYRDGMAADLSAAKLEGEGAQARKEIAR